MMVENNLDVLINKISYIVAKEAKGKGVHNYIEKLLGILVNDGVYAYFIYCKSQKKQKENEDNKQNAKRIKNKQDGINYVEEVFVNRVIQYEKDNNLIDILGLDKKQNTEKFFEELPQNLDELFLFRNVLERILIYARYHLKAMEDNGGKSA